MKKFKTKKHIKIKYKKIILTTLIILTALILLKTISDLKIMKINPIKLIENTNIYSEKNIKKQSTEIFTQILKIDINKPTTILEHTMHYKTPNKQIKYNINKNTQPEVYIYNTHQTEQYIGNDITPQPTVLTAAYYLKEKLEEKGINTIVEETNIKEILNNNNWNYDDSYKASRINLEKIKEKYPNIKIFIDLHRDALPKNLSTVTINNKEYAKVLFLIGKENNNYQKNLEYAESINNILETKYPTLTRGILQKEGPGVNGIYNQDLKENIILMEVGAQENTIEEVTNTLDIISDVIKEKIHEK